MELTAQIHLEEGTYWATIADAPGVFATGDTLDEWFESLREGVALWLDPGGDDEGGQPPAAGKLRIASVVLSDGVAA